MIPASVAGCCPYTCVAGPTLILFYVNIQYFKGHIFINEYIIALTSICIIWYLAYVNLPHVRTW